MTREDFEELADVLEVITTVCDLYDRKFEDLLAAAQKERGKGWLRAGLHFDETEEVPLVSRESSQTFSEVRK